MESAHQYRLTEFGEDRMNSNYVLRSPATFPIQQFSIRQGNVVPALQHQHGQPQPRLSETLRRQRHETLAEKHN